MRWDTSSEQPNNHARNPTIFGKLSPAKKIAAFVLGACGPVLVIALVMAMAHVPLHRVHEDYIESLEVVNTVEPQTRSLFVSEKFIVTVVGNKIKHGLKRRYSNKGMEGQDLRYEFIAASRQSFGDGNLRAFDLKPEAKENSLFLSLGTLQEALAPGKYVFNVSYRVFGVVTQHEGKNYVGWTMANNLPLEVGSVTAYVFPPPAVSDTNLKFRTSLANAKPSDGSKGTELNKLAWRFAKNAQGQQVIKLDEARNVNTDQFILAGLVWPSTVLK